MTDNKKKNSRPSDMPSDEAKINYYPKQDNWRIGKVFWGLLLILIGGLTLASNFGLITVEWSNLWRLWPLIIITTGLSILSFKHLIWRIISVFLVLLTLTGVTLVATGNFPSARSMIIHEAIIQKASDSVKQAEISVKAGASSIWVNTADQAAITKVKLESNVASFSDTSVINGTTQQVNLMMDTNLNNRWWVGDARSIWNIDLSRDLPLELNIDSGATDTNIDMSEAQLRAINIKTGASSLNLKLGTRENVIGVNIESGVSSIILRIPTSSGVQLRLDSGLTSKNLADITEVSDRVYESSGYSQSSKKINISSKIGLSSFTIERY